ncbi:MAG: hypothetical protein MI924_11650 [Chloroflexales bacterium]|nr:hypothetical protein [Chloroflexales bacterium]
MSSYQRNYYPYLVTTTLIMTILLIGCSRFTIPQLANQDGTASVDSYDYPIKPGSVEWKSFKTHDQKVAAIQIPPERLKAMSTAGIVETVLNYPLLGDILLFNSIQQGYDRVSGQFNGIAELYQRRDAGAVLVANYQTMDAIAIISQSERGDSSASWGLFYTQILLAQPEILAMLSVAERNLLLKDAVQKLQAQREQVEGPGILQKEATALLIARLLEAQQEPAFQQKVQRDQSIGKFLRAGGPSTLSVIEEVYVSGEAAIKE